MLKSYRRPLQNELCRTLGILLCLSCMMAEPQQSRASNGDPQNYVQNGSYERGGESWAWGNIGGCEGSVTLDSSGNNAHEGRNSVKFKCNSPAGSNKYGQLYQFVSGLTVGQTYYLEAWCKGVGVGYAEQIATGNKWQFRASIPSGKFGWTHVKVRFTADATSETVMIN
jgi:hypothetical protein